MSATTASPTGTGPGDLPAGVDEAAVRRIEFVASLTDDGLAVPGTTHRVGVDPIVGVLPVAGDAVMAVLSLYVLAEAVRLGVSAGTLARMVANVAVDAVVGSVPVAGTVFDAYWKANRRNVSLVRRDLRTRARV